MIHFVVLSIPFKDQPIRSCRNLPAPFGGMMPLAVQSSFCQHCLLGAVSSADNPFIPGMNLSVALSVAARRALEGEKRALNTLQVT